MRARLQQRLVPAIVLAGVCACGNVADQNGPVDASSNDVEAPTDVFKEIAADEGEEVTRLDASPEASVDAGEDSPTYVVGDYGSFEWHWYGTGEGNNFFMDRDCGVDANESILGDVGSGSGVVATDDCLAFKTLVTSKKMTSALATPGACGDCCDDYGSMTLVLIDGGKVDKSVDGCRYVDPYSKLETEMRRLGKTYAYADAGLDGD